MLLNKANLEIAALASADDTRWTLTGILVEPGRTVATNGHYLGMVTNPKPGPNVEDFPTVKAGITVTEDPLKPCIVPAKDALALAKAIPTPRKASGLPILQHARVDVGYTNANGQFRAITTDLVTEAVTCVAKVQGEFPDYAQVIPKAEPKFTIGFNVEYLERIAHTFRRCGIGGKDGQFKGIKLELYDAESAAVFSATNRDGQEIKIVLMPMRF